MGFGSFAKKALGNTIGGVVAKSDAGQAFLGSGIAGIGGMAAGDFFAKRDAQTGGTTRQEQITAANVWGKLTPEQQKDLLVNNPNIETSQGRQYFDPLTNTIRLEESEFQTGQRGRQEQLARELSGQLLGQDLPGTDPSARFEQGRALLQPQFKQDRETLSQQLADQGLPIGSEAHTKELNRIESSQGRQLQELAFNSVQTSEAQRAARFNEISSLLGQQQVGGVGFGDFGAAKNGLDLFGAEQQDLNRQFQGDQARMQRSADKRNALIGAVGSLGSAGIKAAFSDITLKENIVEVGKSESGIPIYHFDYKNKIYGQFRYEGVMAQDLLNIKPDAVINKDKGLLAVNYDLIDVNFRRVT